MYFNPFLNMLELQARTMAAISDNMLAYIEYQREVMYAATTPFAAAPEVEERAPEPEIELVLEEDECADTYDMVFEEFWENQKSASYFSISAELTRKREEEATALSVAENEGMGTAIQSAPAKKIRTRKKTASIKKWFAEQTVAYEQDKGGDIFSDRIPNRRVYSGIGQAPNAPSAIAVLERHKARKHKLKA